MLSKSQALTLRSKLQAKLDSISKELGYKFTVSSIRYSEAAIVKLQCVPLDEVGDAPKLEAINFSKYCFRYGLKPTDLGREFMSQGSNYRITGLFTNRSKYPIQCVRVIDNKPYKFGATRVKNLLPPDSVRGALLLAAELGDTLAINALKDYDEENGITNG